MNYRDQWPDCTHKILSFSERANATKMNHADYDPQMGFLYESSDDPDEKTKSSLLRHPIGKPEEKRKKKEKYKDLTGDYWNNIKPRGTREDKTQKPSNGCKAMIETGLQCFD